MIPFNTTTVTVTRSQDGTGDPWTDDYDGPHDDPTRQVVASGVRAVISLANGTRYGPGDNQQLTGSLSCDPVVGIDERCTVHDELTGEDWSVDWVWTYLNTPGGGTLDHTEANLSRATGLGTKID